MRYMVMLLLTTLLLMANDKVALVIGNQDYKSHAGLKNPISDAKLIRDTLKSMGFKVMEAYDTSLYVLSDTLDEFMAQSKDAQVAVVYYAGHGIGLGSSNYIIPIGASNLSVDNVGRKLMSLDELKGAVSKAQGFGAVFFDACRSSFFSGSISGLASSRGSRALVQPHVKRGQNILVSFSTQAGTIARDDVDNGNHSPYALALSEKLNKSADIRLVMGSVRSRVSALTNYAQMPVDENQLDGKKYCLSGICKEVISTVDNSAELAKLRVENERLRRQSEPSPKPKPPKIARLLTWMTPSKSDCESSAGKMDKYGCQAAWEDAKKICRAMGVSLPTLNKLSSVVNECGGLVSEDIQGIYANNNIGNGRYQNCYKRKGFAVKHYWSSNSYKMKPNKGWGIYFHAGTKSYIGKTNSRYIRCVRESTITSID